MTVEFRAVEMPRELPEVVDFLCSDEWPFHGRTRLAADEAAAIDFASDDVACFWVVADGATVGLVRLFDLGDIGEGAPQFDLRIASDHRGRGLGTQAVQRLVRHLFDTYPEAHRIEANTRDDNIAMQRALSAAGFTREGRLRESWRTEARWFDTLVYGLLRSDP